MKSRVNPSFEFFEYSILLGIIHILFLMFSLHSFQLLAKVAQLVFNSLHILIIIILTFHWVIWLPGSPVYLFLLSLFPPGF